MIAAEAIVRGVRGIVDSVPDPELLVITIGDLGIVRDVTVDDAGRVDVSITPTYSGCPAMHEIESSIRLAVHDSGHPDCLVHTMLAPPWTTDWITNRGRRQLMEAGIAPPRAASDDTAVSLPPRCPRCRSTRTASLRFFGATLCKASFQCRACREQFDYFKPL